MKTTKFSLALFCLIVVMTVTPNSVLANNPEGWIDQHAKLVSPEDAAVIIEQRGLMLEKQQLQAEQSTQIFANGTEEPPPIAAQAIQIEFAQLAEALENDALKIYQFVRNHFKYEPYYGALKGPYLTLLERSGNDFDQAALLVELLRAAGYTANYQHGTMVMPLSADNQQDLAHWLGANIENSNLADIENSIIGKIIASGGIPASFTNNSGTHILMDRIWVVLNSNTNSQKYYLDPAFKTSRQHRGINLASAMGYSQSAVLSQAGGTADTHSIEDLNTKNLNQTLTKLTTQLLSNLKQNHPTAQINDIVGGSTIIPLELITLPGLPFAGTPTKPLWTEIPRNYIHTLQLKHGGINTTLDIPTIAGKNSASVI